MFKKIKSSAFTVAETMIVLVILGTLFTVIIPSTLNHHRENINRVKIKKSMAFYEVVFKKLVVDNAIMTDSGFDRKFSTSDNCEKIKKQFKIIETYSGGGIAFGENKNCIFRSAEDVWWNINDFKKPIVAVKLEDLIGKTANSYQFSGHIDNGVLRINDVGYLSNKKTDSKLTAAEKAKYSAEETTVQKAYNYINKKK